MKVELLSPSGSFEAAKAAIICGADAIYIGAKNFSARNYAKNFSYDEMKQIIDYAHLYGRKVYLAANTLIYDKEIEEFLETIKISYNLGIDAFIVQDIVMANIIKKAIPAARLHASTQMTIHNLDGANKLYDLGFNRVVLARELSKDEISYIAKNTKIETEVFVHGALCVSYSGQCLFSSFIGQRSANQGCCAQPCRLLYEIDNQKGYYLSPYDLCLIDELCALKEMGVASLKIEGRMKSPEYVALVTHIYRKYLGIDNNLTNKGESLSGESSSNGFINEAFSGKNGSINERYGKQSKGEPLNDNSITNYHKVIKDGQIGQMVLNSAQKVSNPGKKELNRCPVSNDVQKVSKSIQKVSNEDYNLLLGIFSRGRRFTKGHFAGDENFLNIKKSNDDISKNADKKAVEFAKNLLEGEPEKILVDIELSAFYDNKAKLKISDGENYVEVESENPLEKAKNLPLSYSIAHEQLSKLGGTAFLLNNLKLDTDNQISMPKSLLNQLRRAAAGELSKKRVEKHHKNINIDFLKFLEIKKVDKNINEYFALDISSAEQFYALSEAGGNIFYVDRDVYLKIKNQISGKKIYIKIPHILTIEEEKEYLETFKSCPRIYGVMVGNLGHIGLARQISGNIVGDYTLNILNTQSAQFYENEGFSVITLSPELTLAQIRDIAKYAPCEIIAYGKIPLMNIKNIYYDHLIDRTNARFTFSRLSKNVSQLLNSRPIYLADKMQEARRANICGFRLKFTGETPKEAVKIYEEYTGKSKAKPPDLFTRGYYLK